MGDPAERGKDVCKAFDDSGISARHDRKRSRLGTNDPPGNGRVDMRYADRGKPCGMIPRNRWCDG